MNGPQSITIAWPQGYSSDNSSQRMGDMPMEMDLLLRGLEALLKQGVDAPFTCRLTGNQLRQLRHDAKNFDATVLDAYGCKLIVTRDLPQASNDQGVTIHVGELTGNADNVRVEFHTS